MIIINEIMTNFVLLSFFLGVIKLNILMIEKGEQEHQSFKTVTRNILDVKKKSTFAYTPPFARKTLIFKQRKRGQIIFENHHYYLADKKNEKITTPKNINE